jgi:hypothetical protein
MDRISNKMDSVSIKKKNGMLLLSNKKVRSETVYYEEKKIHYKMLRIRRVCVNVDIHKSSLNLYFLLKVLTKSS